MTTMKDVFARTRAKKTQENMDFDFAFGTASAALFLLSVAAEYAAFAALFYAFFCRLRRQGSERIIFPK